MDNIFTSSNIFKNMIWRFSERILAQAVTFVVSVILARKLTTADFGNVALLMVFIDIANVFVIHGFSTALVQKKNPDNEDFSTVLYFSFAVALMFYGVCYLCAPFLETFGDSSLPHLFRVLALRIPLASINSVQHSYAQKKLLFKKFFFSTLYGTIISAFIGIYMAFNGFGAWSIVAQYLVNSLIDTLVLYFTLEWKPIKCFNWKRLKELIGFGWKMLCSQLVHVIYKRMSVFVIGVRYTIEDIAFYEQGNKIPGIVETNIDSTINAVLFPVMSNIQDDIDRMKYYIRRSIQLSGLLIWPLMIGLASISDNVIRIIYTDKWLPAAPFMILACFKLGLEPIQTANLQAIKAIGKSGLYLRLEIIKKLYGIISIIVASKYGVYIIAIASASQSLFSLLLNGIFNIKLFKYSVKEQAKDIYENLISSLLMGFVVLSINKYLDCGIMELLIEIFAGAIIYFMIIYFFFPNRYLFLKNALRKH